MFIYTKLNLEKNSANLIKSKMDAVGLGHIVDTIKGDCDCRMLEANELHITIKNTAATSIDHIKQAILPYPPSSQELDNLGLSSRSIEKWNEKYKAFHNVEMPPKLCYKLLHIYHHVSFTVKDYSAHFGRFAAITLDTIDKSGLASPVDNNPHISTIKCTGDEAQICLNKIDRIGNNDYTSILDLGIKGVVISVDKIEINADVYGENHATIMSKDIAACRRLFDIDDSIFDADIVDPTDEKSNLGSGYIPPDEKLEQRDNSLTSGIDVIHSDNICMVSSNPCDAYIAKERSAPNCLERFIH